MKSTTDELRIEIGVVVRPHGVRGELRVRLHNPASDVLLQVPSVEVEGRGEVVVRRARRERQAILLTLQGVDDRTAALALAGASIRVPRTALPAPAADEYYLFDLVGLEVVDPDGRLEGRVVDVREGPGHATLVVAQEGGGAGVEVPLVDTFVASVDLPGRRVVVRGFRELAEI